MSSSPKKHVPAWKRALAWAVRGLIAAFVWATFIEPELLWRYDHDFTPPVTATAWPVGCNDLKVAVVSDFHVGDAHMHASRLGYIRRQVAEAKPDLILIPGDFAAHVMGGKTLPMANIAERLKEWPSAAPVVAVLGNHDYSDAPKGEVIQGLETHGINVLDNDSVKVILKGGACEFWIAGVGDGFSGLDSVPAAFEKVPAGEPVVFLTHDPRVAQKLPKDSGVAVVIAGHTHGGVACVPGTLWCLSRVHPWTGGWVRGWYHSSTHPPVLVSSGLGNSIYPGRIGSPPAWDLMTWKLASRSDVAVSR